MATLMVSRGEGALKVKCQEFNMTPYAKMYFKPRKSIEDLFIISFDVSNSLKLFDKRQRMLHTH